MFSKCSAILKETYAFSSDNNWLNNFCVSFPNDYVLFIKSTTQQAQGVEAM